MTERGETRDVVREHACLRLQAHLADAHGLRALMAPTTEYRAYHDALPGAPLTKASTAVDANAIRLSFRITESPWQHQVASGTRPSYLRVN